MMYYKDKSIHYKYYYNYNQNIHNIYYYNYNQLYMLMYNNDIELNKLKYNKNIYNTV